MCVCVCLCVCASHPGSSSPQQEARCSHRGPRAVSPVEWRGFREGNRALASLTLKGTFSWYSVLTSHVLKGVHRGCEGPSVLPAAGRWAMSRETR